MKPFMNLSDITDYQTHEHGGFTEKYAVISDNIGAKKLGYNITVLASGCKACPFHNHRNNEEMFLILEGEGILRFGEQRYAIKKDDIIACPPGGREVAHQLINTGAKPLKFLSLSTRETIDVCEYPDSNKVLTMVGEYDKREFSHISKLDDAVDYYEGEE